MTVLAIDAGKSGGAAVIHPDGLYEVHPFRSESDMAEWIYELSNKVSIKAIIEQVHAMPNQGVTSTFSFGQNYGFYRGVLQALHIPFDTVTPQGWQKKLAIPDKLKGKDSKPERKRWLKQKASELFPRCKVTLANCDALLIAYTYAKD